MRVVRWKRNGWSRGGSVALVGNVLGELDMRVGVCVRREPNHGHQEGREPFLVLQLLFHRG